MEIKTTDKFCILTPLSCKLDKRECERIFEEIKEYSNLEIGLDLSFVQDCTIEFIEGLNSLKISAFNISSDIFTLFNIMNIDKKVNLFVSESDFKSNRHRLLNRKFIVLQS